MGKKLELVGRKFNRLTVISEYLERTKSGKVQFLCVCDCGNKIITVGSKLINGHTKSCTCLQKEKAKMIDNSTHRMSKTAIYKVWSSMKSRCYYQNNESYIHYGGRGIRICDRWLNSFENFYKDMANGYKPNLSIDRIDVNGDYEPSNCRWATRIQQESNKRNSVNIPYQGRAMPLRAWARFLGVSYYALWKRMKRGASFEDSVKNLTEDETRSIDRNRL